MLLQIAWRNIWRNKVRSWVVIGAIMLGLWSILFIVAFTAAMVGGYVKKAIKNETSHYQLHHPEFKEDKEVEFIIPNVQEAMDKVRALPEVKAATLRTIVSGMVSSARGSRVINIRGVIPESEIAVTGFDSNIKEGRFLEEKKKNEIIISQKLAERLKLKLRKKVVLQFQGLDENILSGAFRIVGIFSTGNTRWDEQIVLVNRKDLNRLFQREALAHEVAIYLNDVATLDTMGTQLKNQFPNLLVENYREVSPDVQLYESQIDISGTILTTIFMIALIFGIINTMLMAVLERRKELGMLMAVGMNKRKVFSMVVLETLLLGLFAAPFGLLLGWLTITWFGNRGINLQGFSQSLEHVGMETQIYTYLPSPYYLYLGIAIFITALLASLYPAWKAIRLRPVEAIRTI